MKYFYVILILSISFFVIYYFFVISKENTFSLFQNVQTQVIVPEYYTCPDLTPGSYDSSFGINNARIAIIMTFANSNNYDEYVYAINSTKCYAKHFGYQMHFINLFENPEVDERCNQTNLFFKRHCALARFMEYNKETIDYILYLDADMGVVNPCHTIQEYLDKDERIHLIFYERYFNLEFAAGSFLAKNTEISRKFLNCWADYWYRIPSNWNGEDNGALHQVLMELHFVDKNDRMKCDKLWINSKNASDLTNYEACVKHTLFQNSSSLLVNNTVKIICKMSHGWVRDAWITKSKWSSKDFMLHGMKKSLNGERWQGPFVNNFEMNLCQQRSLIFHNFKYNPFLKSTDNEIKDILLQRVNAVQEQYQKILNTLNLVSNTSSPKYGICL